MNRVTEETSTDSLKSLLFSFNLGKLLFCIQSDMISGDQNQWAWGNMLRNGGENSDEIQPKSRAIKSKIDLMFLPMASLYRGT